MIPLRRIIIDPKRNSNKIISNDKGRTVERLGLRRNCASCAVLNKQITAIAINRVYAKVGDRVTRLPQFPHNLGCVACIYFPLVFPDMHFGGT